MLAPQVDRNLAEERSGADHTDRCPERIMAGHKVEHTAL